MRIPLTATELIILRCPIQWTQLYVASHRPRTLFSARLSAAPASFPAAALAFSSGTPITGTIPAGTTVYIGSAAGLRDKGMLRLRTALTAAASGTLNVAEFGDKYIALAANDYLTIVEEFLPGPKYLRYNSGWFIDYDVAYIAQNDNYGPLARLGPPAIGFLVGGHCYLKYVGERSKAYSPGNTLDTFAWSFPDGSTSVSAGTTASPITVDYAAALPHGQTHQFTVQEDVTNLAHTSWRLTFIFERSGANAPYDAAVVGSLQGGPQNGGYTASLRILNTAATESDFPAGAHVILFEEAHYIDESGEWFALDDPSGTFYTGATVVGLLSGAEGEITYDSAGYIRIKTTSGVFALGETIVQDVPVNTARLMAPCLGGNYPYRNNIVMDGWIVEETVRKNPETGEIEFTLATLDGLLKTLEGYPVALTNRSTTPTLSWEDFKRATMNTATLHFVLWRSTIAAITDVEFQEYGPPQTAIMKYVNMDKASLFDQINGYWQRTLPSAWVSCDLQGALYCEMDAVIDETIRDQVPTIWTVDKDQDLRDDLELQPIVVKTNSQAVLYAVGYRKPMGARSPGEPHGYQGFTDEITDGIAGPLISGDIAQPDYDTLEIWAGNLSAKKNNRFPDIVHPLAGNWRIDPVPQCYFSEDFASGDTLRGFTLTDQNWLPRGLRLTFNSRAWALLTELTADAETTGLGGSSIEIGEVSQPDDPTPPPVPTDPPPNPIATSNARETWLGVHNYSTSAEVLAWAGDLLTGEPTWNKVAGALPCQLNHFWAKTNGAAVYVSDSTKIYQSLNPKEATPVWTEILANGALLGGNPLTINYLRTWKNRLVVGATADGLSWYGEYKLGAWTWSGPMSSGRTVLGVSGDHLLQAQDNGPQQQLMRVITKANATVGGTFQNSYASANNNESVWINQIGGHVYVFNFGADTTPQNVPTWRDVTAGTYFVSRAATLADYSQQWLRGAYGGSQLYYVDPDGHFYRSATGLSFTDTYTWGRGIVEDANLSGGGSLLWALKTIEESNEFLRISSDNGATWTPKTGNFWTGAIGVAGTLINLQLVY